MCHGAVGRLSEGRVSSRSSRSRTCRVPSSRGRRPRATRHLDVEQDELRDPVAAVDVVARVESVFTSSTLTSPRYSGSMSPGVFRQVTPCLSARPERGNTKPADPDGTAIAMPVGTSAATARGLDVHVDGGVEVVPGVIGMLPRRAAAGRRPAAGCERAFFSCRRRRLQLCGGGEQSRHRRAEGTRSSAGRQLPTWGGYLRVAPSPSSRRRAVSNSATAGPACCSRSAVSFG